MNNKMYKKGVINDPLGQPTVSAGNDCRLTLNFWDGRTDRRVKIVITTGRNCGRPRGSIIWHVRKQVKVQSLIAKCPHYSIDSCLVD